MNNGFSASAEKPLLCVGIGSWYIANWKIIQWKWSIRTAIIRQFPC